MVSVEEHSLTDRYINDTIFAIFSCLVKRYAHLCNTWEGKHEVWHYWIADWLVGLAEKQEKLRSQRQELYDLIQEREHVANDIAAVKAVQYDKPKITVTVDSDLSQILERIIERCDKLDKRLLECMDILTSMRKKAYELLALCRDTKAKTILYDRYLAGMSWREIEEKRGFTRQWLNRMRDRAIRMISQNTS